MTTYRTIASTETDPEAPITSALMKALDGNASAIAEADTSVPSALRPILLLGTLATTSGTTVTLSGLDLTRYSRLLIEIDGVSLSVTTTPLRFGTGSNAPISANLSNAGNAFYGLYLVSLASGLMTGSCAEPTTAAPSSASASAFSVRTNLSNASTSISFSVGAGAFDAGNIRVYGIK